MPVDLTRGDEFTEAMLGRPPRWMRGSVYLGFGLLIFGLSAAYFLTVDRKVSAMGSVRPQGDLLCVQSDLEGRLLRVHVDEGQAVEQGDSLFEIDGAPRQEDLKKTRQRKSLASQRLEALQRSRQALLRRQESERLQDRIGLRLSESDLEIALQKRQEAQATLRDCQAETALAKEEWNRALELGTGLVPEEEIRAKETRWLLAQGAAERAQVAEQIAARQIARAQDARELASHRIDQALHDRDRELADLEERILALEDEHRTLGVQEERLLRELEELVLRAPASGTLVWIEKSLEGTIVKSGDTMARIAPRNAPWVLEAFLSNRDAGHLREILGRPATVKMDAFPHRDFGVVHGRLESISPDAVSHPRLGTAYRLEVLLHDPVKEPGIRMKHLQLGMTGTAELVKNRTRALALLFGHARDAVALD